MIGSRVVIATALSLALAVPVIGCSSSSGGNSVNAGSVTSNTAQVANPWVDCSSLEEVESHAGFSFSVPESLDGYGPRILQAVDGETAQAMYEDLDDLDDPSVPVACIRKSLGEGEDVSGDYEDYPDSKTIEVGGIEVALRGAERSWHVATWSNDGFSYAITLSDGRDAEWMASTVASVGESSDEGGTNTSESENKDPASDDGTASGSVAWASSPQSFVFSSGAGAWSTSMTVTSDGTFAGTFHDTDMGDTGEGYPNGTRYETNFTGAFTTPQKVGDYSYSMQLARLEITDASEDTIEDGALVRHLTDSVYGLGEPTSSPSGRFVLYLPGQPTSELSDELLSWIRPIVGDVPETLETRVIACHDTDSYGDTYAFVATDQ